MIPRALAANLAPGGSLNLTDHSQSADIKVSVVVPCKCKQSFAIVNGVGEQLVRGGQKKGLFPPLEKMGRNVAA